MKRRLYPPYIKVGKAKYAIRIIPLDSTTAGYCEDAVKLIALDPNQSEKELFSTFIHEMLHAIEKEHRMRLPHKQVHRLEAALAQVLQENFYILPRR